jgi:choline dehydrogenase-like flavoprotein
MEQSSVMYDAIIIGSGFGGAGAAYELTKAGINTLMLERGAWAKRDADDWNAEKIILQSRYWGPEPLYVKQHNASAFKPLPINEVVGGASVFYGGASMRFREQDFASWPLSYLDLEPYYSRAEKILGTHGQAGADPFEPPRSSPFPYPAIAYNPPAARILQAASKLGLRPFPVPLSLNHSNKEKPLCRQCNTCDDYPCKIEAKGDAAARIISQLNPQFFTLMTQAQVTRLIEQDGRITGVQYIDRLSHESKIVKAKLVILSAGALWSPALLKHSFPQRTDAAFGFVGKYLMRHCNGIQSAVFPFQTNPAQIFHKQIAITHCYEDLRQELGTAVGIIQDIYTPSRKVVKAFVPTGLKTIAGFFANYIQSLICIAEDDPQATNGIGLSNELGAFGFPRLQVRHTYSANDCRRRDYLLSKARKILTTAGGMITRATPLDSFSHAVGTVRFGNSSTQGALDTFCRLYGTQNLFVLDGSFMPTSSGVNPSLTILANSLRVGHYLTQLGREHWINDRNQDEDTVRR